LLGISRSRAGGHPFMPLVDDDREFGKILTRTLTSNVTYASDLQLARSDVHPEQRTIESRVSRILSGEGHDRLLIEMIDVTRRARISRENALLIQHGAGRQMIRQLAHEIKNPLGGLRGAAQLLGKQLDNAELREYTDVIISEADRLVSLVDTLLGPGGPPNKHPANIHEIIEYVLRLLEPELGDRLQVVRDYDAGLPTINLDRDQIIQALINLLRNASTALEGRGNLVLRTRAVMNFTIGDIRHRLVATIDIEDDGPGIPADLQDSIFYPLVTSRPEGTGLGLSTAQDLLSRHGGLIEFESRPGHTVFSIHIPVLPERDAGHHG
jgi:two-component system nitrogen regulation sensor histidine kinase GlnL